MGKYLSVAEIRALIPGPYGRPVSSRTVSRWIHEGLRGVRLPAIKPGYYWLVKKEDLEAFLAATHAESMEALK
jgi:excisionase family DNA binding protein